MMMNGTPAHFLMKEGRWWMDGETVFLDGIPSVDRFES